MPTQSYASIFTKMGGGMKQRYEEEWDADPSYWVPKQTKGSAFVQRAWNDFNDDNYLLVGSAVGGDDGNIVVGGEQKAITANYKNKTDARKATDISKLDVDSFYGVDGEAIYEYDASKLKVLPKDLQKFEPVHSGTKAEREEADADDVDAEPLAVEAPKVSERGRGGGGTAGSMMRRGARGGISRAEAGKRRAEWEKHRAEAEAERLAGLGEVAAEAGGAGEAAASFGKEVDGDSDFYRPRAERKRPLETASGRTIETLARSVAPVKAAAAKAGGAAAAAKKDGEEEEEAEAGTPKTGKGKGGETPRALPKAKIEATIDEEDEDEEEEAGGGGAASAVSGAGGGDVRKAGALAYKNFEAVKKEFPVLEKGRANSKDKMVWAKLSSDQKRFLAALAQGRLYDKNGQSFKSDDLNRNFASLNEGIQDQQKVLLKAVLARDTSDEANDSLLYFFEEEDLDTLDTDTMERFFGELEWLSTGDFLMLQPTARSFLLDAYTGDHDKLTPERVKSLNEHDLDLLIKVFENTTTRQTKRTENRGVKSEAERGLIKAIEPVAKAEKPAARAARRMRQAKADTQKKSLDSE